MNPTLHFVSGKLAAGKTTLARRIAEETGNEARPEGSQPTTDEEFDEYVAYAVECRGVRHDASLRLRPRRPA